MALTRKFLEALGIDESKVDAIINAHTETTNAIKTERDTFKADAEKLSEIQKQLETAKAEKVTAEEKLTALNKKVEDFEKADYKTQLANKEKEIENLKNEYTAKETAVNKKNALTSHLKNIGYSDTAINLIKRNGFADKVTFGEDGKANNLDSVLSEIQADADFSGFTPKAESTQHTPPTPPSNNGGASKLTREQILAIPSTADRQKAISENIELFQ